MPASVALLVGVSGEGALGTAARAGYETRRIERTFCSCICRVSCGCVATGVAPILLRSASGLGGSLRLRRT